MSKYEKMWEPIYRNFEERYPYLAEKVVGWYPSGQNEITFTLEDGSKMRFDWMYQRIGGLYSPHFDEANPDENDWRIDFSSKLFNKMRKMGISRERLSELTSISQPALSKYLNGKATPSGYNLRKISKALKCSITELTDF